MAAQRAAADPETTQFEAVVETVDETRVTLEHSYFYAESGGQPSDRGVIDGVPVTAVSLEEDRVVHVLDDEPAFEARDVVEAEVDDAFRTYCRRAHSASHVLYGVARELLDDLGYGGFDISERKVRIDFATTTSLDDGMLIELEHRANQAVWESRPVSWRNVAVDDIEGMEEVAFNRKTEEGVFGDGSDVRIVEIGPPSLGGETGWLDRAACGGTHVRNTREIGPIAVLDRSNPGESLTRVELAVGPTAIEHQARIARSVYEAAHALGVGLDDVPGRISELQTERDELADALRSATDRVVASQIDVIEPVERDGSTWLVGAIDGADTDTLASNAREALNEDVDVVALMSAERPTQLAVASAGDVIAADVVDALTDAFGGGGGGGPEFAQGGGIDAEPDRVIDALVE